MQKAKMGYIDKNILLPETNPNLQINACIDTLASLLIIKEVEKFNPHLKKLLSRFITLCKSIKLHSVNKVTALKLVRTVVAILDVFIMDEMQPRYNERFSGKIYGRAGILFDEDYRKKKFQNRFTDQSLLNQPQHNVTYHYAFRAEMSFHLGKLAQNTDLIHVG